MNEICRTFDAPVYDNFRQPIANIVRDGADQSRPGAYWRERLMAMGKLWIKRVHFGELFCRAGKTLAPTRGKSPLE